MTTIEILHIVILLAVFTLLLILLKKSVLSVGDLSKISDVLNGLSGITGGSAADASIFLKLVEYVRQAVHAVEQMCKTGVIAADDRKDAAMNMIETFALTDGIALDERMIVVVSDLIEAECDQMGHAIIEDFTVEGSVEVETPDED